MSTEPDGDRRATIRQALSVGIATSAYGVSMGALGVASGLTVLQTCVTSLLIFTGGSQFALVGVLTGGGMGAGNIASAVAASGLLGIRNGLYGLQLASTVRPGSWPGRLAAAHLTIDESAAVSLAQPDPERSRLGFWATGLAIFIGWNIMTLAGALLGNLIDDPKTWGLDAAAAAAFLGLIWPRLKGGSALAVAGAAAVVAAALTPVALPGIPILAAALTGIVVASIQHSISPRGGRP